MVVHIAACVHIAFPAMVFAAMLDVVFHVLAEPHATQFGVGADACSSVDDVDDTARLDGVGCGENVPIDDFGLGGDLWNEIEAKELVSTDTIDIGVEIDGEIVVGEFLEPDSDGFFCFRLCHCFHKSFLRKVTD